VTSRGCLPAKQIDHWSYTSIGHGVKRDCNKNRGDGTLSKLPSQNKKQASMYLLMRIQQSARALIERKPKTEIKPTLILN